MGLRLVRAYSSDYSSYLYEYVRSVHHELVSVEPFTLQANSQGVREAIPDPLMIQGHFSKGPFTRAILHVAIVILVYVINSWQSLQQDIRLGFAVVRRRPSLQLNTYSKMSIVRHSKQFLKWPNAMSNTWRISFGRMLLDHPDVEGSPPVPTQRQDPGYSIVRHWNSTQSLNNYGSVTKMEIQKSDCAKHKIKTSTIYSIINSQTHQ